MIKAKITDKHNNILKEYGIEDIDRTSLSLLKFESGEFILLQGNTIAYIFIFLNGKAKVVFTAANGKTLLMAYYTEIGLIGDAELMGNKSVATSSVQTITKAECLGIPLDIYRDYLKTNLAFMNAAGRELAQKLHNSTISNTFNILHSLDARLCAHIAMTNKDGHFKEKLTELSQIMGSSYRHLHRTLERLCDDAILEKSEKGYIIKDIKALKIKAQEYGQDI